MSRYKASYQNDKHTAELFVINFEGDMSEITDQLGIEPTEILKKDEQRNPPYGAKNKENVWKYQIQNLQGEEADETLGRLLKELDPKHEALEFLGRKSTLRIGVGSTTFWYNSELFISPERLQQIAKMGATLWLDLYTFQETYLEEDLQKEKFKHILAESRAVADLGISTQDERNSITEALALCETMRDIISEKLFPEYAGGETISDTDLQGGLLEVRSKIRELHEYIEKSPFFMSKDK